MSLQNTIFEENILFKNDFFFKYFTILNGIIHFWFGKNN